MAGATTDRQRLRAARELLKAEHWCDDAIYHTCHPVVVTYARPVADRDAATRYVQGMEAFADHWDEEFGPLWLGHALHSAFLAGVDWGRTDDQKELADPTER